MGDFRKNGQGGGTSLDDLMRLMRNYYGIGRNDAAATAGRNAVDQSNRRAATGQKAADIKQRAADTADAQRWHQEHVRDVGMQAVGDAMAKGMATEQARQDTIHDIGMQGVDEAMDTELQRQATERMQSANLARRQGTAAVADAFSPDNIRAMIARMSQPSPYTPEEAAAYASWQGENAVAGVTPPQGPAGWYPPQVTAPNPMMESTQPGYAPPDVRARHYGLRAIETELLNKEPE